jgi:hypothetical protein
VRTYVLTGRGRVSAAVRRTGVRKEEKKGRMINKSRALMRRPLWIITSYQNNRMEVLTIDSDVEGGGYLAIFSFEEEAEAFLGLLGDGEEKRKGWQSEQTKAGELVSVLLGPSCVEVKRVALDPLPLPQGRAMLPLVSVNRETFLQYLSEEGRGMAAELASSVS